MKLNRKILLVTISVLFVSLVISSFVNIINFRKHYTDALVTGSFGLGQSLNSVVEEMLNLGLPLESLAGMDKKVKQLVESNPYISYAAICDLTGRPLFHSDPTLVGKLFSDEVMKKSVSTSEPLMQLYKRFDGHEYYDVTLPIVDSNQARVGIIRLGFRTEVISDKVWDAIIQVAINFTLSFLLIAWLINFLLSRLVSRPIIALSALARKIADGQFDMDVSISGNDEIGTLSSSLHTMATTLKEQIESLKIARSNLEKQVTERTAELQAAQRIARVGSWQLDLLSGHVYWSEELYTMQGLEPDSTPPDFAESAKLFAPESWERLSSSVARAVEFGAPYELELEILKPDGSHGWMLARGEAVRNESNAIIAVRGVALDITERKKHEQQLENIAHYDALTNLPNRVLLADRLHQGMAQAHRREQRLAVVYLDLDGFKAVNDNHGHDVGDQLLIIVAIRMKQALREGDTLARIGGDEFVAVLQDLSDIEPILPMLKRLLTATAQPVEVDNLVLQVSASLGVTFYPQNEAIDADQLLRQADQAMYQAKLAGKNRYRVFDAEHDSSVRGYHENLEEIRRALIDQEFVLHFQPKVNMRSGAVVGAEALIRWQHPEKGLLPPGVFLPVIEDHPLAVEIGEWVIDTALTQVELWHQAGLEIPVSVNVGAFQLQHAGFVANLRAALAAHPRVAPSSLEIEVLETSALGDIARVSQVIAACREIGVSFALDDFGTGYSSLTYLKRLPVSLLKIDQSFVRDMLDDPDDLAILEGVLGLASAFHRNVIAEGVETIECGEMLLQLGCDLGQGYGIAKPMPSHEILGWAASWRPDVTWTDSPPINRDDTPILFASVELRAWIAAIVAFLKGEVENPPPSDPHQCHFGQWLDTKGLARHHSKMAFKAVDALHHQVHTLAAKLLTLHVQGKNADALARLGELHALRDELLEELKLLVRK